ncbi:MAG: GAF domain-containing protein [Candidatus Melainabacteria bacterium]|nr:GAF domain-containing protein [Candidatus Melainabacteria bacterium]
MAKNLGSKASKKSLASNIYGDAISAYIEECRQFVARARRQEVVNQVKPSDLSKMPYTQELGKRKASNGLTDGELQCKEEALRQLEDNLAKREVELIEREIKYYSLQQELDQLRPLSGLYRVVRAMATERKLDSLLEAITRETKVMLKCDRCSVFVLEARTKELWAQIAQGLEKDKVVRVPIAGNSIVGLTARTGKLVNIPDAYSDSRFDPEFDKITGYFTRNILCVPMHNRNAEIIGVFEVLNKVGGPFSQDDGEWLEALAAVAAGLIEQAQSYSEIEHFVNKTLETLAQTIDKRDPLTAGHSIRVTKYSLILAEQLKLPEADMDVLRYAAMMHDYGKIGVPEAILWKNGRLTPEEYALVQTHARITYELLSNLPFTRRLASVPFVASCHHEKLDGSGYYRGLKGGEIPFLSRIITVADVFDALTSVRHYRNRMNITKVTEIIESGRENHFDSQVVDAFMRLPCDQVLKVMESERGQIVPTELDLFNKISWQRLVELCDGAKAESCEADLQELFERIYNAGLPSDYQALD